MPGCPRQSHRGVTLAEVVTDAVLYAAFAWLQKINLSPFLFLILSRRLVAEHQRLVWSKDRHMAMATSFGKSVASAGHAQLRTMLAYKCTARGREFLEVPSRLSTKTCSACGSLSGPTGYAGLQVRQWKCAACGAAHDRDVNAAINTLHAGVGMPPECHREVAPGIPVL